MTERTYTDSLTRPLKHNPSAADDTTRDIEWQPANTDKPDEWYYHYTVVPPKTVVWERTAPGYETAVAGEARFRRPYSSLRAYYEKYNAPERLVYWSKQLRGARWTTMRSEVPPLNTAWSPIPDGKGYFMGVYGDVLYKRKALPLLPR